MKKKFLALLLAALMVVTVLPITAFATSFKDPEVSDVSSAGYDVSGKYVLVVHFGEQITKDVVWTGTYNAWSTNVDDMKKFVALDGFPGWYVTEFEDESPSCQGKIVQFMNDGSFNAYYQAGDAEALVSMAKPGAKTMSVNTLTTGETMCTLPEKGVYIYDVQGFTYPVIDGTAKDANGSITVVKTARKNATVTVTVNPASGYQLKADSLVVSYNDGEDKTITPVQDEQEDNKYTFKMPAYPVIVTAEFEETSGGDVDCLSRLTTLLAVAVSTTIAVRSITGAAKLVVGVPMALVIAPQVLRVLSRLVFFPRFF